MELYATGTHTLTTLRKMLKTEFGKVISRANIGLMLRNKFYVGSLEWAGETYSGTHPIFVEPELFARVQEVLGSHNRPKYSKRDGAFRGLM